MGFSLRHQLRRLDNSCGAIEMSHIGPLVGKRWRDLGRELRTLSALVPRDSVVELTGYILAGLSGKVHRAATGLMFLAKQSFNTEELYSASPFGNEAGKSRQFTLCDERGRHRRIPKPAMTIIAAVAGSGTLVSPMPFAVANELNADASAWLAPLLKLLASAAKSAPLILPS